MLKLKDRLLRKVVESIHLRRYSKPHWTWFWAAFPSWTGFELGGWNLKAHCKHNGSDSVNPHILSTFLYLVIVML